MTRQELADSFWVNEDGSPLMLGGESVEGLEVSVDGFRFKWVRNSLGQLYRKSVCSMVGAHLARSYTVKEYQEEMERRAKEHEASLPLSVRLAIRPHLVQAMLEVPLPRPASGTRDSGASFEGRLFR